MKPVFLFVVGAAWLLAAVPAAPHHAFAAEFDINRPVTLTGTVTRIEWTNPHAWVFIDANDDNGNVESWAIELVGINDLLRLGWGRDKVNARDVIDVQGSARKTAPIPQTASVSLASTREPLWASVPRNEDN